MKFSFIRFFKAALDAHYNPEAFARDLLNGYVDVWDLVTGSTRRVLEAMLLEAGMAEQLLKHEALFLTELEMHARKTRGMVKSTAKLSWCNDENHFEPEGGLYVSDLGIAILRKYIPELAR